MLAMGAGKSHIQKERSEFARLSSKGGSSTSEYPSGAHRRGDARRSKERGSRAGSSSKNLGRDRNQTGRGEDALRHGQNPVSGVPERKTREPEKPVQRGRIRQHLDGRAILEGGVRIRSQKRTREGVRQKKRKSSPTKEGRATSLRPRLGSWAAQVRTESRDLALLQGEREFHTGKSMFPASPPSFGTATPE